MWSDWLVFCDCGFQSVCPLMKKDKKLMETSWWERIWPPDAKNGLVGKDPDAGKDWRQEEKGMTGWDGWMASLFATSWTAACQASLFITNSQSLLKLMSIESVMPSSHLIIRRPLLLLPPILPSIRVFSSESALRMRWPKYWSFSFSSIIPSKEHPGLIFFRMDWLDLLAVPQFESINSLALSLLYGPTLTSIHG